MGSLALTNIHLYSILQGLRLRLRLDGTDGCNDFWRLVDSKVYSSRSVSVLIDHRFTN